MSRIVSPVQVHSAAKGAKKMGRQRGGKKGAAEIQIT
jgi:hypothetical protein